MSDLSGTALDGPQQKIELAREVSILPMGGVSVKVQW